MRASWATTPGTATTRTGNRTRSVRRSRTPGACTTCTATSPSSVRTGPTTCRPACEPIPRGRARQLVIRSYGFVDNAEGLQSDSRATSPPAVRCSISASGCCASCPISKLRCARLFWRRIPSDVMRDFRFDVGEPTDSRRRRLTRGQQTHRRPTRPVPPLRLSSTSPRPDPTMSSTGPPSPWRPPSWCCSSSA